MKLKTRMKIAFVGIAMLPLVLISICGIGLFSLQANRMNSSYGVQGVSIADLTNPTEIINLLSAGAYDQLSAELLDNPVQLDSEEYQNHLEYTLRQKGIHYILRKNEQCVYTSRDLEYERFKDVLPAHGEMNHANENAMYHGNDLECLIRQIDIEDELGNQYSVSLIAFQNQVIMALRYFWAKILITLVLLMIMISGVVTTWIYRGTIIPLRKLSEATKNISEGNLDFEISPTGDQEIKGLCADFELMRRKLKESREEGIETDRQSRELIRNISHDLKTPITAIKGYVEGLKDGIADTDEKRDKYLKTIYNKAIEMDRLIDELTLYSKIDANKVIYNYNPLNIYEFFGDCSDSLAVELESKNVEFEYQNVVAKNVEVIADAEQLSKVINNIISNSIKYQSDRKLKIGLHVMDEGDFVRVELEDNGIGIGKEDIPHIFERSYRADLSRNSATGGSGIGLSIVKKIIEDHGGRIWVESKEHEGTKMCFVLRKYVGGINE